jgi:hypothetical protein
MGGTMGHAKLVERANKIWGKEKWAYYDLNWE